ncbi:hypothetical protein ACIPY0_19945 [Paenarthrobacter nicotinovorans]|uniref:hypothetical protein n=1 Tax=Paenarthrobacter nicotinovorans TaxID=29320 RepID=UPI00278946D5|nr:hypothetical protein [Paenarthrobacter nicotinovorans]MDP9934873.1 putative membrane protein YeaQ/YmgE (transglycosylase-associated protein family) [Paenarthrobacter nicotinovorans]
MFNKISMWLGGPWSARLYGTLNSYGSVVVEMRFSASAFRGLINDALSRNGWLIEDDRFWESERRLTVVRLGPQLVGSNAGDAATRDLMTALSCIPNKLELVDARHTGPAFAQVPAWTIDENATIVKTQDRKAPRIYGDRRHVLARFEALFPQMIPIPANAAARELDPETRRATIPGSRWAAAFTAITAIIMMVSGWLFYSQPDLALNAPELLPVVAPLTMVGIGAWVLVCHLVYKLELLVADRMGKFKGSEFNRRFIKDPSLADSPVARGALRSWSWPNGRSAVDSGIQTYMRIRFVALSAGLAGPSFAVGGLAQIQWATRPQSPDVIIGTIIALCFLGVVWLATQLVRARLLLRTRTLPQLTLNIASAAIILTILTRFPAWAYLLGMEAGHLVGVVDWTQLLSFTPAIGVLVLLCLFGWLAAWYGRQMGSGGFLMTVMFGVAALVGVLNIAQSEMMAGYNLRLQGTSEFAKINYPVRACMTKLTDPTAPQSVWLLGSTGSQTIVTTRSPSAKPLTVPGHVSAVPSGSIILDIVSDEAPADGASVNGCPKS